MNAETVAVRLSKIVITAGLALWVFLVTLGNLTDYESNWAFVRHVLALDTIFSGSSLTWRAITNPAIQTGAYLATEALICLSFLIAAIRMSAKLKAPMQGGILMGDFALHTGDLVFGYDMGGISTIGGPKAGFGENGTAARLRQTPFKPGPNAAQMQTSISSLVTIWAVYPR